MTDEELSEIGQRASDLWRDRGWDQARDDAYALLAEVERLRAMVKVQDEAVTELQYILMPLRAENAALREIARVFADVPVNASSYRRDDDSYYTSVPLHAILRAKALLAE